MKYILDGVPLTDPQLRWFPDRKTGVRIAPARRASGIAYPHTDGEAFDPLAAYEPGMIAVNLNIEGPTHREFMLYYEFLLGLMSQRHKLLEFRHQYDWPVINRRSDRVALVEVQSIDEPKLIDKKQASLEAVFRVPGAFWRGDSEVTNVVSPMTDAGTTQTLTLFNGGTAPINDAIIRFAGGFDTAKITDEVSRRQLRITNRVPAGSYLVVDTATHTARLHSTDSWSLTSGVAWDAYIVPLEGYGSAFTFEPEVDIAAMKMRYRVTIQGTNVSGSPHVAIRAKNSYL